MIAPVRLPRHRVQRRRLGLLALAALASLTSGAMVGARAGGDAPRVAAAAASTIPRAADHRPLSLRKVVGQTIVLSFSGTRVPPYVTQILREGRAAGVILFRDNVGSLAGARALTRALQHAGGGSVLVMTDQEGGSVRTFRKLGPVAGEPELNTPTRAASGARLAAAGLHSVGVNVDLAPVVDVARGPATALAARAYPGGAAAVAASTSAAVLAYARAGVGASAKHFPGLGAAGVNTDQGSERISLSAAELDRTDLRPFRAAIAAGVPLVMVGHASYPALDAERIASQSRAVITDLLRGRLGFSGAVLTDSLEARAVISRSGVGTAALRSMRAGADLLLLTGPGSYPIVYRHLLALAGHSPSLRTRLAQAARRTLALKARLGLRPPP